MAIKTRALACLLPLLGVPVLASCGGRTPLEESLTAGSAPRVGLGEQAGGASGHGATGGGGSSAAPTGGSGGKGGSSGASAGTSGGDGGAKPAGAGGAGASTTGGNPAAAGGGVVVMLAACHEAECTWTCYEGPSLSGGHCLAPGDPRLPALLGCMPLGPLTPPFSLNKSNGCCYELAGCPGGLGQMRKTSVGASP